MRARRLARALTWLIFAVREIRDAHASGELPRNRLDTGRRGIEMKVLCPDFGGRWGQFSPAEKEAAVTHILTSPPLF